MKSLYFWFLLLMVSVSGLVYLHVAGPPANPSAMMRGDSGTEGTSVRVARDRDAARAGFTSEIDLAFHLYQRANRQAYLYLLREVTEPLQAAHAQTNEFVQESLQFRSQMGIVGRQIHDAVHYLRGRPQEAAHVQNYFQQKFEAHFFNDQEVAALLKDALRRYALTLQQNRRTLREGVRGAIHTHGMAADGLDEAIFLRLEQSVSSQQLSRISQELARAQTLRLVIGLVNFDLIWGHFASGLVQGITQKAQLGMMAKGISAAGATAKGATAGAAVGTKAGPAGTLAGTLTGILAGIIVDQLLEVGIREQLVREINQLLADYRELLIFGGSSPEHSLIFLASQALQDMEGLDAEILAAARAQANAPGRLPAQRPAFCGLSPAAEQLISERFQHWLGRQPGEAEQEKFVHLFLLEGWLRSHLDGHLQQTPEYRERLVSQQVHQAYRALLGRAPDPEGYRHYRQRMLEVGWSLSRVEQDIRRSREFRQRAASLRNTAALR